MSTKRLKTEADFTNKTTSSRKMKIRCDVCDKEEASVFCPSDEAALCDACDRHVHHANKLASKHVRFSLLRSTAAESPLCDICQVRRAFLFCQQDRAILCRECDIPIHKANEHTQKHSRFLLTGVKLSSASFLRPTTSSSSSVDACDVADAAIDAGVRLSNTSIKRTKMVSNGLFRAPLMENLQPSIGYSEVEDNGISDRLSFSTSSISEYLESLPGWCVEEFLDQSCAADVFCKV